MMQFFLDKIIFRKLYLWQECVLFRAISNQTDQYETIFFSSFLFSRLIFLSFSFFHNGKVKKNIFLFIFLPVFFSSYVTLRMFRWSSAADTPISSLANDRRSFILPFSSLAHFVSVYFLFLSLFFHSKKSVVSVFASSYVLLLL